MFQIDSRVIEYKCLKSYTMFIRRFLSLRTILPVSAELKQPCSAITRVTPCFYLGSKGFNSSPVLCQRLSCQIKTAQDLNLLPYSKTYLGLDIFLKSTCLNVPHIRRLHHGRANFNDSPSPEKGGEKEEVKKLSLFQRFKAMYRDYWYVLVPVHVVTSAVWYGSFYYMARTGVDIAALAELAHFSDETIEKIRKNSNNVAGHLAIAYLLYKVVTPLRYTVTLGGTTVSINYLKKWGWIKPIPKKEELRKMLDDKKLQFRKKRDSFKERQELMRKSVINKLPSKKRMKKTSDLVKRMLMRKKNAKRS